LEAYSFSTMFGTRLSKSLTPLVTRLAASSQSLSVFLM
jgi:hypothetical protein